MAKSIPEHIRGLKNKKATEVRPAAPGQKRTVRIEGTDSRGTQTSFTVNTGKGTGLNSNTNGVG